jgi:hypothetical protein
VIQTAYKVRFRRKIWWSERQNYVVARADAAVTGIPFTALSGLSSEQPFSRQLSMPPYSQPPFAACETYAISLLSQR